MCQTFVTLCKLARCMVILRSVNVAKQSFRSTLQSNASHAVGRIANLAVIVLVSWSHLTYL